MPSGFNINGVDFDNYYIPATSLQEPPTGGQLWAWGANSYGLLGLNSLTSYSSPVQVGSLSDWKLIETSCENTYYQWTTTYSVKTDGSLWVWGSNFYGQLGLNESLTTHRSSPTRVGTLTNWKSVSCSFGHVLAVKTDGTLWSWGLNSSGQLGLNNITHRSSPIQVGTLTNWNLVATSAAVSLAIKTDGSLWAWGTNNRGELGIADRVSRSSPTQVGTLTNWAKFNAKSIGAIKTDGSLWTWGYNGYGTLGLNDRTHRSSPTQVGSLTDWSSISSSFQGSGAIKTDGSLWTWGLNRWGDLGLNDITHRSSPTRVGSLTNWQLITAGVNYVYSGGSLYSTMLRAIKTDGTLWAWGYNLSGQIGDGSRTNRSSPVQIGTLTTWITVTGDVAATFAVKAP